MQVTVSEAMRMKKEVSYAINEIQSQSSYRSTDSVSYGETFEDGQLIYNEGKVTIVDKMNNLENLLSLSEKINSSIANFNHDHGVGDLVRNRQNMVLLLHVYQDDVCKHSKETVLTKRDKDDKGKTRLIKVEFKPHMSKVETRDKVKELKRAIKESQARIDMINASSIDLPFSEDAYYNIIEND